jgi:hypothetical protein
VILPCVVCESCRSPAAKVALGQLRAASVIRSSPSRTIAVSIDVDTSATLIARRQGVAAKARFRSLLKALRCAEGKAPIESQRSRHGYGSVHSEFFIGRQPERSVRITQLRPGIWNSAPDGQAASGCSKFRFRLVRRRVAVQPFPPLCRAGHSVRRPGPRTQANDPDASANKTRGHRAEHVIGPRFARTRWRLCPSTLAEIAYCGRDDFFASRTCRVLVKFFAYLLYSTILNRR